MRKYLIRKERVNEKNYYSQCIIAYVIKSQAEIIDSALIEIHEKMKFTFISF